MNVELTEPEKAYITGLFDGEGHVSVLRTWCQPKYHRKRHILYRLQLGIGNTNTEVLEWLVEKVGGKVYAVNWKAKGNRKLCWQWRYDGKKAEEFLKAIYPYSIIKRRQIEEALGFLGLGSEFVPAEREEYYHRFRELNRRGVGAYQPQPYNLEGSTESKKLQ